MAISKELAVRLQAAGFPYRRKRPESVDVPIPSLAELMVACMPEMKGANRLKDGAGWEVTDLAGQRTVKAADMDEALAQFWLSVHSPH